VQAKFVVKKHNAQCNVSSNGGKKTIVHARSSQGTSKKECPMLVEQQTMLDPTSKESRIPKKNPIVLTMG